MRSFPDSIVPFVLLLAVVTSAFGGTGESRFVSVDNNKVHYTNFGAGEFALLLVHGWACDETVWRGQTGPLSENIRVLTIDLPGHGQSDKPHIPYTMKYYVRAIDAVLQDAGVSGAVLVGHSNGTPVIREFYREHPAKVKGLVVVDGALRPFADAATVEKFIAPLRADHYEETLTKFIESMTRPINDAGLREQIKTLMLRTPQYVAVSEFEATTEPDLWKPDKIDAPVLMILARQPVWTAEYEQFVRTLVPKLDYQTWPNVSHFIMMEKPQEFNAAVLTFLQANHLAGHS